MLLCVSKIVEQRQGCFVLAIAEQKAFIRITLGTFLLAARRLSFPGKETFRLELAVFAFV